MWIAYTGSQETQQTVFAPRGRVTSGPGLEPVGLAELGGKLFRKREAVPHPWTGSSCRPQSGLSACAAAFRPRPSARVGGCVWRVWKVLVELRAL